MVSRAIRLGWPLAAGMVRGANQAPAGAPIPQIAPAIIATPDAVNPTRLTVQSAAVWTNSPTSKTYQWRLNGALIGSPTSTPQPLDTTQVGNYRLTEEASNASGSNFSNSNTIAVVAVDTTPDAFAFTDVSNATVSTIYTSNTITVSGINRPADVTLVGGEYQKNGATWATAATTANNGDTFALRNMSSVQNSTTGNATLTIGGVSDTWSITTAAAQATAPAKMAAPSLTASPNAISVDRANSTADGGSAITRYDLRYGTDGTNYTVAEQTADPQSIAGLTNGTAYRVSTRAVNSVGAGPWSDDATATPVAAATAPAQMQAPTLTPGDKQITVARAAAPSDGGSAITSYDARYGTDGTNWTTITGIATNQVIGSLVNGTAYQVQTRAVNAVGAGAWSASATATPGAAVQRSFDYLVVAGGGGGGSAGNGASGGGGGGGVLQGALAASTGSWPVTVGAGGAPAAPGADSSLDAITAKGGGAGGGFNSTASRDGGSGGGGGGQNATNGNQSGGLGTSGQGTVGGVGSGSGSGGSRGGGGGGGASAAGADANLGEGGAGGAGFASSISGAATVYGSGGGGGRSATSGVGGAGGDGAGSGAMNNTNAGSAVANRGGGGGGTGSGTSGTSGSGGSGIVIASYPTGTLTATGGTVTTGNGRTIHTFTANGTFQITAIAT